MLGPIFVFGLLGFVCLAAIARPYIGVLGYYGFAVLQPQWNWRWSIPQDLQYQKFIAAATFIGLLLSGFAGNRMSGKVLNACALLLGFLGLAFVSAQSTIAPSATEFYLGTIWKLVLFAILGVLTLDDSRKIHTLLWVLVLAQGYNAYQINLQYFQDGFSAYARMRTWGLQGDNNVYSILTVPLMGVGVALGFYAATTWQRLLAWGIAVLQAHQIMLLESRGCMLGSIVMGASLMFLVPKSKVSWSWIIAGGILVGGLAGPPVVEEFTSSFASEEERDSSADSRFYVWKAGFEITRDNPLLGVGPFAGQYLVPDYYEGGLDSSVKGLHNLFFEISTGCGIPATLAYLGFFAIPTLVGLRALLFRSTADQLPDWAACSYLAATCGLIGYWASSMFSSGALSESSYAVAAAGIATMAVLRREAEAATDEHLELDHDCYEGGEPLTG